MSNSPTTLFIDTETFCEIELPSVGAATYVRHPSAECMLLSYTTDSDYAPGRVVDFTANDPLPRDLRELLEDPEVIVEAHNANFDRQVLHHLCGIDVPLHRWRCTMARAFTMGLPGALGQLGDVLGFHEEAGKLRDGKALIRLFCKPQTPSVRKRKNETDEEFEWRKEAATYRASAETHPAEWRRFKNYALRDAVALREVSKRVPKWNLTDTEVSLWHLDQRINDRGMPVDIELAERAMELCETALAGLHARMRDVTGGAIASCNQTAAIPEFCRDRGVDMPDCTADTVSTLLEQKGLPAVVREVLLLRQEAGRTSTSKYRKFMDVADPVDHRARGTLQYYGALRTGRWAGRLIQPQNFPRPSFKGREAVDAAESVVDGTAADWYPNLVEVGVNCLRPVICAPEGMKLVAGDYSNIEGRMLAWLTGEEWKLQAFRDFDAGTGPDLYILAYSKAFGIPVEDVVDALRQVGKVMELALGYQGALGALASMASNYNMTLPEESVQLGWVKGWRKAHPHTVRWWYELEDAAKAAVRNPGHAYRAGKVLFKVQSDWLLCKLPSGRFLCYHRPSINKEDKLSYGGFLPNTTTWGRLGTYGGKLSENITQAASRDVMAHNMPLTENAGYEIVGSVHDELITLVPEGFGSAEGLEEAMGDNPPWCPDLPLSVGAWEGKRYRK